MSWIRALLIAGLLGVPLLLRFPAVQAEGDRVAVPALILPDVQDGLYYESNDLIVAADKRITLDFNLPLAETAVTGNPAGRPPFRP